MPTERSRDRFGFEVVAGRQVLAAFGGGEVTSDAGAPDRAIGLVERFAACVVDGRTEVQVEHSVAAMVRQRIFGRALGYEDPIDHHRLRCDPVRAVLTGKLQAAQGLRAARRQELAPSPWPPRRRAPTTITAISWSALPKAISVRNPG